MNRTATLDAAIRAASRLAHPWTHTETLTDGSKHTSRHPGLIPQLRAAAGSLEAAQEWQPPVFGPKAPVREEPFAVLHDIGRVIPTLAARCGAPNRGDLALTVAAIIGTLGRLNNEDLEEVEHELSGLMHRAEVALSWALRARKLRGECPACNKPDAILVRLDDYGPSEAVCVKCDATWDRTRLGVLAGAMSQSGHDA